MSPEKTLPTKRRYDVDWLRVIALGLLILYHVVISFQPWGVKIFFIQNEDSLEFLWIFMAMINIWRIPILFIISGMGVRFAMERRNWKELLKDRTIRILVPLVFGFFFVCPISIYFALLHFEQVGSYIPNDGHLWFLGNIFLYVLIMLPLFTYLKNRPENIFFRIITRLTRVRGGLFLLALPVIAESILVGPDYFSSYAKTPHGFWLGMICFIYGYTFISIGKQFWLAVKRDWVIATTIAFLLYLVRVFIFGFEEFHVLTSIESICWMLAAMGLGAKYLNTPSKKLPYFSQAVYPVYIIHMPVQYFISYYIIPLSIPAIIKFLLLLAGTFGLSLLLYEMVIKQLKWVRPLFGLKIS